MNTIKVGDRWTVDDDEFEYVEIVRIDRILNKNLVRAVYNVRAQGVKKDGTKVTLAYTEKGEYLDGVPTIMDLKAPYQGPLGGASPCANSVRGVGGNGGLGGYLGLTGEGLKAHGEALFRAFEPEEAAGKKACQGRHEWVSIVLLTSADEYCRHCGEKKV